MKNIWFYRMQGLCHIAAVSIDTSMDSSIIPSIDNDMVKPKSGMFTRWWAVIRLEYRLLSVAADAAWAI